MAPRLAGILDTFATRVYDGLIWALARAALVEVRWSEVKKGSREVVPYPHLPAKIDPGQARFLFQQQEAGGQHTDDKVKQLLTLSAGLNAAVLAFGRGGPRLLLFGVAGALTAAVLLCMGILRVRAFSAPLPEDPDSDLGEHRWAKALMSSAATHLASQSYRVDLYSAARRWFVVALLLALALAGFHRAPQRRPQEASGVPPRPAAAAVPPARAVVDTSERATEPPPARAPSPAPRRGADSARRTAPGGR